MTSKSKLYCSVPQCSNYISKTISMHRFPRNVELAKKWQEAMKIGKPISKYMMACSEHFLPQDYFNTWGERKRKYLKKNAIPSQKVPVSNYQRPPGAKVSRKKCSFENIEVVLCPETSNETFCINTPLSDPLETHIKIPLNIHYKCAEEIPDYECNKCNYTTPWKVSLLNHLYKECENKHTMEVLQCDYCSFKTNRKMSLLKHLRHHVSADNSKWYKCHLCSYKNLSLPNLRKHQLEHEMALKKVEEFCTMRTITQYKCQHCTYKTHVKTRFDNHMIRKHMPDDEIDWFECNQCCYKGKTAYCLKRHKAVHNAPSYVCAFCPFRAKTNAILRKHILFTHTPNQKIPVYSCDECEYKTEVVYRLKAHKLVHQQNDRLRYQCPFCSYAVLRKQSLKSHLINKHNIDKTKTYAFMIFTTTLKPSLR